MWKKLVFVVGLIECFNMPLSACEPAHDANQASSSFQLFVARKGKLVFLPIRPQLLEKMGWCGPGLQVGKEFYGLDFGNDKTFRKQAELLYNKDVLVEGFVEKRTMTGFIPDYSYEFNVLNVTALEPDMGIEKTIKAEAKGKLKCVHVHWLTGDLHSVHDDWNAPQSRCERKVAAIEVNGKLYLLNDVRPTSANDAKEFARLCGRKVVVTGMRSGDTIQIHGLVEDKDFIKETVSVQLRGKLQYVMTQWNTGEVLFTCDELPNYLCKCWSIRYGVSRNGKLYLLDLGDNKKLEQEAKQHTGRLVVVKGVLNGDQVQVESLRFDVDEFLKLVSRMALAAEAF